MVKRVTEQRRQPAQPASSDEAGSAEHLGAEHLGAKHLDAWTGDPDFMLSLGKGLLVLHVIGNAGRRMSTSEIAALTGLSRATARRCIYTLGVLGYLSVDASGGVAGRRLASLVSGYIAASPLISGGQPILYRLRDTLNESVSLWTLEADEPMYLASAEGARRFTVNLRVGARRTPLYCTSIGRVQLAFWPQSQIEDYLTRTELRPLTKYTVTSRDRILQILAEVRASGYAIGDQEAELGLRSITAAVTDLRGEAVAAINVGTVAARVSLRELKTRILPPLLEATAELSSLIP